MARKLTKPTVSEALTALDDAGARAQIDLAAALGYLRQMAAGIAGPHDRPGDGQFAEEVTQDYSAALTKARCAVAELERAGVARAAATLASGQCAPEAG